MSPLEQKLTKAFAGRNEEQIISLLTANPELAKTCNLQNQTVLWLAVYYEMADVVKFMLSNSEVRAYIDFAKRDIAGRDAYYIAEDLQLDEMIELFDVIPETSEETTELKLDVGVMREIPRPDAVSMLKHFIEDFRIWLIGIPGGRTASAALAILISALIGYSAFSTFNSSYQNTLDVRNLIANGGDEEISESVSKALSHNNPPAFDEDMLKNLRDEGWRLSVLQESEITTGTNVRCTLKFRPQIGDEVTSQIQVFDRHSNNPDIQRSSSLVPDALQRYRADILAYAIGICFVY